MNKSKHTACEKPQIHSWFSHNDNSMTLAVKN